MHLSRRFLLSASFVLPAALAGCGDDGPPRTFAPLHYDYLVPLRLNVATLDFADLPPPGPLDGASPLPPGPALRQMAEDRLSAAGSSGRAVVRIDEARISRAGSGLEGSFAMRVDVFNTANTRSGFAEARVARTVSNTGRDLRGALYDMTKQMLDDMNVELEFQIRRSLRDYVQTTSATAPTPAVQQQDLRAPSASAPMVPPPTRR